MIKGDIKTETSAISLSNFISISCFVLKLYPQTWLKSLSSTLNSIYFILGIRFLRFTIQLNEGGRYSSSDCSVVCSRSQTGDRPPPPQSPTKSETY